MPTKIKFVDYGEQVKVKVVDYGEDLKVVPVSYGEEMKAKIVSYGEDLKVKIVSDSSCLLATSAAAAVGLPDNCPELVALRAFRDDFVRHTAEGREFVARYYRLAPVLLLKIADHRDSEEIHRRILDEARAAITLINSGREAEAFRRGVHLFEMLADSLLSSG